MMYVLKSVYTFGDDIVYSFWGIDSYKLSSGLHACHGTLYN